MILGLPAKSSSGPPAWMLLKGGLVEGGGFHEAIVGNIQEFLYMLKTNEAMAQMADV